jgi:hypothetical protein
MATDVNQAFSEFQTNLEITDRQVNVVSSAREGSVGAIGAKLSLYESSPSHLIGSYDRHTLIRPLSGSDVDVMVVLNYGAHKEWDTAEGTVKVLDRFKTILDDAYPKTDKRRDRNCINMRFAEFRLDVVPAFRIKTGGFQIPDTLRESWLYTDPPRFAELVTAINKKMENCFVPLIKMVKAWAKAANVPVRSFHLECIMYNRYQSYVKSYTYPSMLAEFFEALPGYLSGSTVEPTMGDRVDGYLDNGAAVTDRSIAIDKAKKAASSAREAYDDQEKYPSVAIKEWKALLGDMFPSYG